MELFHCNLSIAKLNSNHFNRRNVLIILGSKENKRTYAWTCTVSDVITVKQSQSNEEVELIN